MISRSNLIAIGLVALVGFGVYYFKFRKPSKKTPNKDKVREFGIGVAKNRLPLFEQCKEKALVSGVNELNSQEMAKQIQDCINKTNQ